MFDNILSALQIPRKKGPMIGVDIGTVSIKAAEISPKAGKPNLTNYGIIEIGGYLERMNSVIQTSSLKIDEGEAVKILKELILRMGTKTREAVAVIPSFASFISLIDLPVMSAQELEQAIPYQAKSLVPLPISDVTIDWTVVGNYEDEKGAQKQQVLLISILNEQLQSYQAIFKKSGLKLRMVEIEGLSLARSVSRGEPGEVMILDIGGFTSTVAIASGGSLRAVSQTDFAGNALTQALVKGLGINPRRAESLKRQRGLSGMAGEYGLSTLMLPFIDVILSEAKRTKDVFEAKHKKKIEKVLLSGGGGDLVGLSMYVSKQLGIPTEKGNPFKEVSYSPEIAPLAASISSRFAVAIGSGIKNYF